MNSEKKKLEIIPKVHIRDKDSYVDSKIIVIPCYELFLTSRTNDKYFLDPYFKDKEIIYSSIIPDEHEFDYFDYLQLVSINRFILMSPDFPLYEDFSEDQKQFYLSLFYDDFQSFVSYLQEEKYPLQNVIGLLKGTNQIEYTSTYDLLKNELHCKTYMIYLSGHIRSNPKYFNPYQYLLQNLPKNFQEPLYLYGYNIKAVSQLEVIRKKWNIKGIISERYHADAVYRGNPHYKRETRMKKAWEKYQSIFFS